MELNDKLRHEINVYQGQCLPSGLGDGGKMIAVEGQSMEMKILMAQIMSER
jgi:hypothetical protein